MAGYTEEIRERELIRLMEQYGDGIKRMCLMTLRDMGAAEDAAQETFIKAYEHIEKVLGGEIVNERSWLARIAINTCRDALRSSYMRHIDRRKALESIPLSVSLAHEEHIALTQAIMALPDSLREIVLLYYYQGFPLRSCARMLGISAPTATRRLQKAQKRLRDELEERG